MTANDVVPASGSSDDHRLQVRITAGAAAASNHSAPAYSVACSTRSISTAVTIPSVPLPPRRPQNRSGFSVALARRTTPSPVTTSNARTVSDASPWVRATGPRPPPVR